jgi:threonyl-tRNA synthetase
MLIVGEKEETDNTISVRKQGAGDMGTFSIEAFADLVKEEIKKMLE